MRVGGKKWLVGVVGRSGSTSDVDERNGVHIDKYLTDLDD